MGGRGPGPGQAGGPPEAGRGFRVVGGYRWGAGLVRGGEALEGALGPQGTGGADPGPLGEGPGRGGGQGVAVEL